MSTTSGLSRRGGGGEEITVTDAVGARTTVVGVGVETWVVAVGLSTCNVDCIPLCVGPSR